MPDPTETYWTFWLLKFCPLLLEHKLKFTSKFKNALSQKRPLVQQFNIAFIYYRISRVLVLLAKNPRTHLTTSLNNIEQCSVSVQWNGSVLLNNQPLNNRLPTVQVIRHAQLNVQDARLKPETILNRLRGQALMSENQLCYGKSRWDQLIKLKPF